jgi:hypothetical protein
MHALFAAAGAGDLDRTIHCHFAFFPILMAICFINSRVMAMAANMGDAGRACT